MGAGAAHPAGAGCHFSIIRRPHIPVRHCALGAENRWLSLSKPKGRCSGCGRSSKNGVREHDADADGDEHQPAQHFHALAEAPAEAAAAQEADDGNDQRHRADHQAGGDDVHLQQRQRKPHTQRVNAGGDREHHQRAAACGIIAFFNGFFCMPGKSFQHHAPAHPGQQQHGDPVVEAGDQVHHCAAQKPSQQGHAALEQPKMEGQAKDRARCAGSRRRADAQRDREAVHGQPKGDHQQHPEISHILESLRSILQRIASPAMRGEAISFLIKSYEII